MTGKEWTALNEENLRIYSGILFHNQILAAGNADAVVRYQMDCPEFVQLRQRYSLERIAGTGSDFARARRLMHYLAPRLHHSSWYDNHVPCNALELLAYSLDNPEQGINCLNKAKILTECCLALGICARRVFIMPYSPYDFDNHVVTEIYDRKRKKWIMLDPTTDGYFVDEQKTPLSLLELRDRFANDAFATFVLSTNRLTDLEKWKKKYAYYNAYICKNLFYFKVEQVNRFGPGDGFLCICPVHYSVKANEVGNMQFRINHLPEEHRNLLDGLRKRLENAQTMPEPDKTGVSVMQASPTGEK